MYKLLVVFSQEGQSWTEDNGLEKLFNMKKGPKLLTKGYDWDIKEFDTAAERSAYIKGLEDGNGWTNDPEYVTISQEGSLVFN